MVEEEEGQEESEDREEKKGIHVGDWNSRVGIGNRILLEKWGLIGKEVAIGSGCAKWV